MKHYIYQNEGWPHFTWEHQKINSLLTEVLTAKGFLFGQMSAVGLQPQDTAHLDNITKDIVTSAEIEGEKLNLQEVRSSIARKLGISIADSVPSKRNVDGLVDMMLDAFHNYNAPLTDERLFGWHNCLFPTGYSGFFKIDVAMYRKDQKGPMQVVSGPIGMEKVHYVAPPAAEVPADMNDFLEYINNSSENLIIKAAVAHLWFVSIHPFDDGNGRITRAITDMLLTKSDNGSKRFYSMSAQIQKEKKAYYGILEKCQQGSLDITEWMEWFLLCLKRALEAASNATRIILLKYQLLNQENDNLNPRQKKMIGMLFEGFNGNLTSSKWAKINKVTQMTANRDITDLLGRGLLIKHGDGRSTHYTLPDKIKTEEEL